MLPNGTLPFSKHVVSTYVCKTKDYSIDGRNTNSGFTRRKLYEYPFPVMIRTPYYLVYLDLKSSQNKKDLNDVTAALFSVFFFAAGS